jgi:glutaminyl-peptide cyclotransferase
MIIHFFFYRNKYCFIFTIVFYKTEIKKHIRMKLKYLAAALIISIIACEPRRTRDANEIVVKKPQSDLVVTQKASFIVGDPVELEVVAASLEYEIDSVQFFALDKYLGAVKDPPFVFEVNTDLFPVGELRLRTATYFKGGGRDIDHASVTLLSDVVPVIYDYRVRDSYPHDLKAFTQGLTYHNGFLYEGTGQKGESSIRKIDLETGEILQIKYIPSQYFGEGITIHNNKLYQLTWRSRKGFVYNLDNFELIREFNYHTEGWGLTNIGDTLVMSDGSSTLYMLNAETLTEIGRISVFDQYGPITELNELEYINGEIYANIYQSDEIAIIDPKTGKLTGAISLSGLLDMNIKHREIDVLNGIAYDATNNRLFVTGKNWTHLFEIELIRREPVARVE